MARCLAGALFRLLVERGGTLLIVAFFLDLQKLFLDNLFNIQHFRLIVFDTCVRIAAGLVAGP